MGCMERVKYIPPFFHVEGGLEEGGVIQMADLHYSACNLDRIQPETLGKEEQLDKSHFRGGDLIANLILYFLRPFFQPVRRF